MVDPRERDPRFPNRPTHPDFILMSEVIQENDHKAEVLGQSPFEMIGIDFKSLAYVLEHRFGTFNARIGPLPDSTVALMKAVWLDGLALGKVYGERRTREELGEG